MGNGKKGPAPCGHDGECVIGTYYECLQGCKTAPEVDFEIVTLEIPQCPYCKSFDVDEDFELDPMFYYFNPGVDVLDTRCNNCGKCWTRD